MIVVTRGDLVSPRPDADPSTPAPPICDRCNDGVERVGQRETLELDRIDHAAGNKPRR